MAKEILSLQEKMVQIRAKIPALVKRMYSEEVSYDFTKIDDIFRYLTPAMNEYKVNWEIESEKATVQDASGNPMFIRYLEGPMLWLYEADLAIRWINAELPEDTILVTIHAIGTHEMPEKAKGSGWTYALKYYLLDKYCIDQGGEDPDMRGNLYSEGELSQQDAYGNNAEGDYEESEMTPTDMADGEGYEEQAAVERPSDKPQMVIAEDENPPVSEYIRPQNGRMVELPESAKQETAMEPVRRQPGTAAMSLEEASDMICTIGTLKGMRLGDIAQQGEEGIENLNWIAYSYRGKNARLREGARLVLETASAA